MEESPLEEGEGADEGVEVGAGVDDTMEERDVARDVPVPVL